MKKILKAVKNEMVKLFSKKATYFLVITVVILASAPIVLNKIVETVSKNSDMNMLNDVDYEYEYNKKRINGMLNKNMSNTNEREKILVEKIANFKLNQGEKIKKANIERNTWKEELNRQVFEKETSKYFLGLLKEGYKYLEIESLIKEVGLNISDEVAEASNNMKEIDKYIKEENDEYNRLKNLLSDNDYFGYVSNKNVLLKKQIQENKEIVTKLEKLLKVENNNIEKNENKIAELQKQIEQSKSLVESNESNIKVNDYIIANKIEYNIDEWKHKTLNMLQNENQRLLDAKSQFKTEKEYYLTNDMYNNIDSKNVPYDKYIKSYNKNIQDIENEIKKDWYAIENNIPINAQNAKNATATIYDNLIVVIVIIIAGEIVAREFSTGTIRLTLTRPIKRWKLLLSKLLTTYAMLIVFAIITYIVGILTGGILYGFSGFAIPELAIGLTGNIIEQSFLMITLKNTIICLLPAVFFVTLAFMLSTVTKSSALSVGISIGGLFASSIANMMSIFSPMKWLQYTPLPYANFASFFGEMGNIITQNNIKYNMNITLQNGSIMLTAYIVIFLVISFLVFTKSDIKNQ